MLQFNDTLGAIYPLQFSCESSVEQNPQPLVAVGREFSLTPACRVVHQPDNIKIWISAIHTSDLCN